MDNISFKNWLKLYRQAWEDKDPKRFSDLFSENIKYYWTPFNEPKVGKAEVCSAFENATSTQMNIKFGYDVLYFENNRGICRWWSKFIRISSGNLIMLDGIFFCEFDKNNLCKVFREWWHKDGE